MKFEFIENIERDMENWRKSVLSTGHGVMWKEFLPKDFLIEQIGDDNYLKNYLEKNFYTSDEVSNFKDWLENNTDASQIQKDLEILMDKKAPFEKVKIFITTFHRAPYNFNDGFFYLIYRNPNNRKRAITNIYHELMHLFFHKYYWEICEKAGLNYKKTDFIKEASTVFLNPILEKRELPLDKGYPIHQKTREKMAEIWQSNQNFSFVLEEIIKDICFNHR